VSVFNFTENYPNNRRRRLENYHGQAIELSLAAATLTEFQSTKPLFLLSYAVMQLNQVTPVCVPTLTAGTSKVEVGSLALLLRIRDVQDSNIGPETGYPD
jgi:hypothetical protein